MENGLRGRDYGDTSHRSGSGQVGHYGWALGKGRISGTGAETGMPVVQMCGMLLQEALLDWSEQWAGLSGRALAGSRTFQIPLLYITVSFSLAVHFLTPTYINIQRHVLVCSFK